MRRETPNSQYITDFSEDLRDRYQYDKLCDWPIEELQGEEWLVKGEIKELKDSFPQKKSVLQGEYRQFMLDGRPDDKIALTPIEKEQLARLEKDIIADLNRALGTKKEERREYRKEMVKLLLLIPSILISALKELKSWLNL